MVKLKLTKPDGTIIEVECTAVDFYSIACSLGIAVWTLSTYTPIAGGGVGAIGGGVIYDPKKSF